MFPLSKIDAHQNLGGLPQLNDVDDVLAQAYREAEECERLRPCKAGEDTIEADRSVDPLNEIQRDKEELVAEAEGEKSGLNTYR